MIADRDSHFSKEFRPSFVTENGMEIEKSDEQYENTEQ
jgi:hypothetical protein